jgi:hypothetical protein
MLTPALRLARDERRGGKNFLRLIGRAYADPAPFIRHFLSAQYAEVIARYKEAFHRALPHLSRQELTWRLHFVMGALSYTLAGTDALKLFSQVAAVEKDNDELLIQRLAPFLVAGLKAPALSEARKLELVAGGTHDPRRIRRLFRHLRRCRVVPRLPPRERPCLVVLARRGCRGAAPHRRHASGPRSSSSGDWSRSSRSSPS